MPINRECTAHLDQTIVLIIIQVFPDTFFPILQRHRAKFPFLTGRTLGSSFSFSPFLSLYTSRSLTTRRSLRSSFPPQSSITFSSITSDTSSAASWSTSTIIAGYAGNATNTTRLLVSKKKILKMKIHVILRLIDPDYIQDWFAKSSKAEKPVCVLLVETVRAYLISKTCLFNELIFN